MPGKKHVDAWSAKANRMYEHIKEQYMDDGLSEKEAEERAARTVNKWRADHGETKKSSDERELHPDFVTAAWQHRHANPWAGGIGGTGTAGPQRPQPEGYIPQMDTGEARGMREEGMAVPSGQLQPKPAFIHALLNAVLHAEEQARQNKSGPRCQHCGQPEFRGPLNPGNICPWCGAVYVASFHPTIPTGDTMQTSENPYDTPAAEPASGPTPQQQPGLWQRVKNVFKPSHVTGKWVVAEDLTGHDPVVDGPNVDDPPSPDRAENSFEQDVALQTWVDTAADMLSRGEEPGAVLAKLAHDGCPNPEEVLQTALMTDSEGPEGEMGPVSDAAGEDAFGGLPSPSAQDASTTLPPQGMTARVAGLTGTVTYYEDLWGRRVASLRTADGKEHEVDPDKLEQAEKQEQDPVSEVQAFIDSFPEVEARPGTKGARIENLRTARLACIRYIGRGGLPAEQMLVLDEMARKLEAAERTVRDSHLASDTDVEYIEQSPRFRVGDVAEQASHGGHGDLDFSATETEVYDASRLREDAEILANELEPGLDEGAVAYRASSFIDARTAGHVPSERMGLRSEFISRVVAKYDGTLPTEPQVKQASVESDVPVEALFN